MPEPLTDEEQQLIDSTQWPTRSEDVTADALIRHGARLALAWHATSDRLSHAAFSLDRDDPACKPTMRKYLDAVIAAIGEAQVAIALVYAQSHSAEVADGLAKTLWEITEDGGALFELMFDYLDDRGIPAERLWELEQARAKAEEDTDA